MIVVDNGSQDGSPEAVRSQFPSVTLIENGENLGFAKANNFGIRQANGRYYCLINSDVEIREGCLDQLVNFMDSHPDIGMAGPKTFQSNMEVVDSCRIFPSIWTYIVSALYLDNIFPKIRIFNSEHLTYFSHDEIRDVDYLAGCFMMVRREVVDSLGPLDERFFIYQEEVDWCKRIKDSGWRITFFPGAEAVHHHAVSSSKDPVRFSVEQLKSILQYWDKHAGPVKRIGVIAVLIFHYGVRYLFGGLMRLWSSSQSEKMSLRFKKNSACLKTLFRQFHLA